YWHGPQGNLPSKEERD
ncbi:hypothetical protein A2U01_0082692, partial [Trifolium medium]|nr:hypothetical protein [Trifolium medium]